MVFVEKMKERVNWCMDEETNNAWKKVRRTIKIITEKVLRKSRERTVNKDGMKKVQEVISRKKKFKEYQYPKV